MAENKYSLIEIKNISKSFPGVKALSGVSMNFKSGEVHALIGENGAGKSTLIKILAGVYHPDLGAEFWLEGSQMNFPSTLEALKMGIVVIYQDFSLFPNLSVAENIAISVQLEEGSKIIKWKNIIAEAQVAIDKLGVDIDPSAVLGTLPVAKQQLVAICRALVYKAKLIIMDEPTSALSKHETELLLGIMRGLRKEGISIVFVSHKLDELFKIADRFTVLRDGELIGTENGKNLDEKKLISMMVGRSIEYKVYEKRKCNDVLLQVKDLTRKGNFKKISFDLHKGEILGITGLVGAGRTEVLQALFGLTQCDSGDVFLNGKSLKLKKPSDALEAGLSYVPENRLTEGLILKQSVANNISLPILKQITNVIGSIDVKHKQKIVMDWINKLSIKPSLPNMLTNNLSGGNKQKVVIAKWLAANPNVLLIDEPTNGIDVGAKAYIHKLLRNLAADGMGIIMVSSELPEVLSVSDRILVMRRGWIAGEFQGNEATQERIMNSAILDKQPREA